MRLNRQRITWSRRAMTLLVIALALAALTACTWVIEPEVLEPEVAPEATNAAPAAQGRGAASASAPATDPAPSTTTYLATALNLAPSDIQHFAFTDWRALKRLDGVEVNSDDSMDARMEFMMPLATERHAIATGFGMSYFFTHADDWRWDSTDLLWESTFTVDGPPVYVLRFRDDFDFAAVFALLEEREYTQRDYGRDFGEVTLFQHEMDFTADWIGTTEFAILNIAYFAADKTFILASSEETLLASLDAIAAGDTLHADANARAVIAPVNNAISLFLEPDGCALVDVASEIVVSPEVADAIQAIYDNSGIRHAFDYFAFAYVVEAVDTVGAGATSLGEAELPLGIYVHHYANAAHATADMGPRRDVATNADSLATNAPYANLFEVVDASVSSAETGANLILRLHAPDRAPQLFLDMLYRRDLLFSICGG